VQQLILGPQCLVWTTPILDLGRRWPRKIHMVSTLLSISPSSCSSMQSYLSDLLQRHTVITDSNKAGISTPLPSLNLPTRQCV